LLTNTAGTGNTANGYQALLGNVDGDSNTAIGFQSLQSNTTGTENTAAGSNALNQNNDGFRNNAFGSEALASHVSGNFNNAFGGFALNSDTNGSGNCAFGNGALILSTGINNTAVGFNAGSNLTAGNGNVYIGSAVSGVASETGHTYIRNIEATSVSGGGTDTVTINLSTGLLGHLTSSRRYKEDIKPIDKASEALYRLKPVSYRYKKEIDSTQSPAFGLIAEEVEEVDPALVARNSKGEAEAVHYEMVNAMLLNEFLKEHRTVKDQGGTIEDLKKEVADLTAVVKEQAAQMQKLSTQVQSENAASQVVLNNP
jgi:hypothetical protein